jgi:hypothetical protein
MQGVCGIGIRHMDYLRPLGLGMEAGTIHTESVNKVWTRHGLDEARRRPPRIVHHERMSDDIQYSNSQTPSRFNAPRKRLTRKRGARREVGMQYAVNDAV